MESKSYYQTTTLPYVNADPHLGFALEIVQADVIARYKRLFGYDVFFNFGTDEHGQKIYQKALEEGKSPKVYCDEYAIKFNALKKALNLSYNNFIRTTDPHHIRAAQEFWDRCYKNDDIYKKNYKIKYCVGCELEKTDSELKNGKCPLHPNLDLEIINEENYFFKFSKYQKLLLNFYENNPKLVIPDSKFNEIKTFVKNGIQDFSVSRLKKKMPWGIDIPGDPEHVMFVWFDALVNYVSAIGWPEDKQNFKKWWPVTQFAGKDNLRQQTAIWQAMLMSAGLSGSKQIFIHGFITVNGQKISKSLGNVVNPIELVNKYGTDALRYYLLAKIPPFNDGDFSIEKFRETYNADLANGLGNLVARVARLCEKVRVGNLKQKKGIDKEIVSYLKEFELDEAINVLWSKIKSVDQTLNKETPWTLTDNKELSKVISVHAQEILDLSYPLQIFLPATATKIEKQFSSPKIKSETPLFPRIK